jgi:hypothetical protein
MEVREIILEKENISVSSDSEEICLSAPGDCLRVAMASQAISSGDPGGQETGETSWQ